MSSKNRPLEFDDLPEEFHTIKGFLGSLGVSVDSAGEMERERFGLPIVGQVIVNDKYVLSWYFQVDDGSIGVSLMLPMDHYISPYIETTFLYIEGSVVDCMLIVGEEKSYTQLLLAISVPEFYSFWAEIAKGGGQPKSGTEADAKDWLRRMVQIYLAAE